VITAGRPEVSEVIRRVSLPEDDEEFMPAEGKTPLTEAQVRIIEWWIQVGAPTGTSIGALGTLDPETEALISAELGLGG
jgi:hypothetical protein